MSPTVAVLVVLWALSVLVAIRTLTAIRDPLGRRLAVVAVGSTLFLAAGLLAAATDLPGVADAVVLTGVVYLAGLLALARWMLELRTWTLHVSVLLVAAATAVWIILGEPLGLMACWAGGHLAAAAAILHTGWSAGPALHTRVRAAAAAAGLSAVGVAPLIGPSLIVPVGAVGTLLWISALLPPWSWRWLWLKADIDRFDRAEAHALASGEDLAVLVRLLEVAARLLGADRAWYLRRGRIAAAFGISATAAAAASTWLRTAPPQRISHYARGRRRWLVAFPAADPDGWLVVETRAPPVLFGPDAATIGPNLAVRIGLAVARAERAAEQAERERRLREAERERFADDVLSTLSHELRTPLVAIYGMSELLTERWGQLDDGQRRELVATIRRNADTLKALVEDTLLLATIRAGELRTATEEVRVGDLVAAVLDHCRHDARIAVLAPAVELLDRRLRTDLTLCARAVGELVDNALKFSTGQVRFTVQDTADGLIITIDDEGRGMTPEEVAALTAPGYRAGDVLRRDTRGLGVGATLAVELLRRLGGDVTVTSTPGAGTSVRVRLPAWTPAGTDVQAV